MNQVDNKPLTFLQRMKIVFKNLQGKDEDVINNIDQIENWEESVSKINTFSESDRKTIKEIQNTEAELRKLYKVKLENYKKKLESQVNGSKGRKKGTKYKKAEQTDKEIGE